MAQHGSFSYSQRPYVRRRPKANNYHESIFLGVEMYKDERYLSDFLFAITGLQPGSGCLIQEDGSTKDRTAAEKQAIYTWKLASDWVPAASFDWPWVPQVNPSTPGLKILNPINIFNAITLNEASSLFFPNAHNIQGAWKDKFASLWTLGPTSTMSDIEKLNQTQHDAAPSMPNFYSANNIGLREDWFTDAVFAQQAFTGTNPATIAIPSVHIKTCFVNAAIAQNNTNAGSLINTSYANDEIYAQDCHYFREAAGVSGNDPIVTKDGGVKPDGVFTRYGCAPVTLFTLNSTTGVLHPIAICIDYVEDETQRVIIFNKNLSPGTTTTKAQKDDWPWRYAKTCAQVADWARHELGAHLVRTHLIEEAVIVAAERNMDDSHIILQIMHSHWITTLSLNANVRTILIQELVQPISPFSLKQTGNFIQYHRQTFDFKKFYVPADLEGRGFPTAELMDHTNPKFHNYTYGRGVFKTWGMLHEYVSEILTGYYANDAAVAADTQLQAFINEVHEGDSQITSGGGWLPLFPTATTIKELIGLVTMCIHIASTQHTAINYLQQYYMTFIPNKPGSLYTPLPANIAQLNGYGEQDLLNALPLKAEKDWIMMAMVPFLLSAEVDTNDNINTYATTASNNPNPLIAAAGTKLKENLVHLATELVKYAGENDDKAMEYTVLYPDVQASAIVI